ncbi:hypothetical protein BRC81_15450 [Halobacteriales archaeon QS_1_68_20]|nr:MAG: hypothetical protein BRC81_15450 [Halobacteriales archaeon QS_1_68_20]
MFDESYTTADDPHYVYYGSGTATWQRYWSDGAWVRIDGAGGTYVENESAVDVDPATIRQSEAVVRSENESTMVVEVTDGPTLDTLGDSDDAEAELLFVVEKGPTPHLARIEYTGQSEKLAVEVTLDVVNVGASPVEHPDGVPRAGATSAFERAFAGAERILGWVF